jgi:hypothetical protein
MGIDEAGIQSVGRAAAFAETGHRLHELASACVIGWRIDGKAAELPIQANRTQARSSDKGVARNIVDLEGAAVDVAQHEIGRAGCVNRGDAGVLPLQTDRADEGGAGDLVVGDVVDFETAGLVVAQQQIGFAGIAAEITEPDNLPRPI